MSRKLWLKRGNSGKISCILRYYRAQETLERTGGAPDEGAEDPVEDLGGGRLSRTNQRTDVEMAKKRPAEEVRAVQLCLTGIQLK